MDDFIDRAEARGPNQRLLATCRYFACVIQAPHRLEFLALRCPRVPCEVRRFVWLAVLRESLYSNPYHGSRGI